MPFEHREIAFATVTRARSSRSHRFAVIDLADRFCNGGFEGPVDWAMHTDTRE
jgi:hypothetical protein